MHGLVDVAQVLIADDTTCVLDHVGAVWCWGGNEDGGSSECSVDLVSHMSPPRRLLAGHHGTRIPGIQGAVAVWGEYMGSERDSSPNAPAAARDPRGRREGSCRSPGARRPDLSPLRAPGLGV